MDFARPALTAAAGTDPWALQRRLGSGDPAAIESAALGFRAAAGRAAQAVDDGRNADRTTALAFRNNGAPVFDADASTARGCTLLAARGERMEEAARALIDVAGALTEHSGRAGTRIGRLDADLAHLVGRLNDYLADNSAALTPESAAAAEHHFRQLAVTAVRDAAAAVQSEIDGYTAMVTSRTARLNALGYGSPGPAGEPEPAPARRHRGSPFDRGRGPADLARERREAELNGDRIDETTLGDVLADVGNLLLSGGNAAIHHPDAAAGAAIGAAAAALGGAIALGGGGITVGTAGAGAAVGAPVAAAGVGLAATGGALLAASVGEIADAAGGPDRVEPLGEDKALEQHRVELGSDPATRKFRAGEAETGLRVEESHGVTLRRAPDAQGPDWIGSNGKTYDAVGNFAARHFDQQWPSLQRAITGHLEKADFVPVDISKFTPSQAAQVRDFIKPYGPRVSS